MGSSNMDNYATTSGDVEDQRQNPNWFVNHKHMLRSNQEDKVNELGYKILKLPECWRQPPCNFSPIQWHFGLHNRENLDSDGSEAIKLDIAVQYGLVEEKWVHFCDEIVDDPKAMLVCYGLQNKVTNWTDEQIKHVLALDALLIATFIDLHVGVGDSERLLWTPCILPSWENANFVLHTQYRSWMGAIREDLLRVENQIPFVLIANVVKYFSKQTISSDLRERVESNADLIEVHNKFLDETYLQYQQRSLEFVYKFFSSTFFPTLGEGFKMGDWSSSFDEQTHILRAGFGVICGSREDEEYISVPMENPYIHIPSATELEQSGIKIVGVAGPLCKMSYEKERLYLPKIRIHDGTMSWIQNLAWYETSNSQSCLFTDYYMLMTDLIQALEDWNLLVKCGVIYDVGGRTKGFENWSTFQGRIWAAPSSKAHNEMKEKIVRRCDYRRYKLWSEFKILFCSRPWVVLSTIAIVLVTMATLVQTYTSVIGSNKMKPRFP